MSATQQQQQQQQQQQLLKNLNTHKIKLDEKFEDDDKNDNNNNNEEEEEERICKKENKDNDTTEEEEEKEEEYNDSEENDDVITYINIDNDINEEIVLIQKKEKTFNQLFILYSVLDKFFLLVNFTILLFSILLTESNISLVLSIYTLSFSLLFDNKKHITTLEKLIVLYQDEIIPKVNKCIRKYKCQNTDNNNNNNNNSDIINQIQNIEKHCLKKHLGIHFSTPKRLRSLDWKKICLVLFCYVISFISLTAACYLKSIDKLNF